MSKSKSAESSTSKAAELADQLTDDLKKVIENLDEQDDVVKMKKQAKEVADVATEFIKEYPLQTVAGAAVIGLALGYLIGRRK